MVGLVLAGGENKRFPFLKGFVEIDGVSIIERNIDLLRPLVSEVVISANEPEHYFSLGVPIVGDTVPCGGPIAGICSVLEYSGADAVLVVACDMPFVSQGLLGLIKSRIGWADAAVPLWDGKPEPLLAVYSSSALGAMHRRIALGERSLVGLLDEIEVSWIDEQEVGKIDPEGRSFMNINTLDDLRTMEKLET